MDLKVEKREKLGRSARLLKNEGLISAELYGKGIENIHLSVDKREFQKVWKIAGENTLINIIIGSEKRPVMIYDVACNPITDEITNIDFYQVKMDEKITVAAPLEFTGVPPAVKNKGGVLVKAMHELEVEALPTEIPHSIKVDLSLLTELNQSLYVKDIHFLDNVKVLIDGDTVVAIVKEKEVEKFSETEGSIEDIKVEGDEKVAQRQAQKQEISEKKESGPKSENKE